MIEDFNAYLGRARYALARRASNQCPRWPGEASDWLYTARAFVLAALGEANRMRDRKRAALCLRILNWIRADIARTV